MENIRYILPVEAAVEVAATVDMKMASRVAVDDGS